VWAGEDRQEEQERSRSLGKLGCQDRRGGGMLPEPAGPYVTDYQTEPT